MNIIRKSLFLFSALLMLGFDYSLFAASVVEEKKPDIIFILIDSLRSDHVGSYGYLRNTTPNIDKFAKEDCVRFETVIPGGSWTQPAVMTLFTSLSVDGHKRVLPNLSHNKDAVTLAEALRAAGYQTIGITANAMTHRKYGYGKGFDLWDDFSATLPPDVGIEKIASGYARGALLTRMGLVKFARRDKSKPLFLFLFYMDPHWDYNPPPPYDRKFSSLSPQRGAWQTPSSLVTEQLRQRVIDAYDGEIAYCDKAISDLLESLRKSSRWEDTIVVIAGDHGESFWERGFSGHGNDLHDSELKVPLFIRVPKARRGDISPGSVVKGQVGGIDIAPTILDLASIDIPKSWRGKSLRSEMLSGRSEGRVLLTETRIRAQLWQRAVRTDRWKVISIGDFSKPSQLYDLESDPEEKINLAKSSAALPEDVNGLMSLLRPEKEGAR